MASSLKGVVEREKAEVGFFITLESPTLPMLKEAGAAGFYVPAHFPGLKFPKLQSKNCSARSRHSIRV